MTKEIEKAIDFISNYKSDFNFGKTLTSIEIRETDLDAIIESLYQAKNEELANKIKNAFLKEREHNTIGVIWIYK